MTDEPIQFSVVRKIEGYKIIVQSNREVIRIHEHKHIFDAQATIDDELKKLQLST